MFKDGKRGGLAWHQTKMIHPKRAERHWLAIAIAILWQVSVGGAVDANLPISSMDELPPNHIARRPTLERPLPGRGWGSIPFT